MPRAARTITRDDVLPLAQYELIRADKKQEAIQRKALTRISVGPYATAIFETWDSMWLQIHEMLRIEKGGEAQIADELSAYNPLIPKGRELVATVMLEIEDPVRRAVTLKRLGGIENHMFLTVAGDTIRGVPEGDLERTKADGKTSSVHFVHFPFTGAAVAAFRKAGAQVIVGFDHPEYAHMAVMPEIVRQALSEDFD